MRIALAQMEIAQGDIESNIAKMRRFVSRARKADVLVFPEYALTGSVRGRPDLIDRSGRYRRLFSEMAREGGLDIVSGSFVESVGGRHYNTSCYFERSGKCLSSYRKVNLWHSERGRLQRGKGPAVFDTRFGKAGLAICWDLADPMIFRRLARGGARIVYVPSFWSDAGISNYRFEARNIDNLCFVRALENECAIAYANAAGRYCPGDDLIGHSQLAVPIRGAVRKLAHNREGLMTATLPQAQLSRAAHVYKLGADIRNGYTR
jgi:predicted amidohydrolase